MYSHTTPHAAAEIIILTAYKKHTSNLQLLEDLTWYSVNNIWVCWSNPLPNGSPNRNILISPSLILRVRRYARKGADKSVSGSMAHIDVAQHSHVVCQANDCLLCNKHLPNGWLSREAPHTLTRTQVRYGNSMTDLHWSVNVSTRILAFSYTIRNCFSVDARDTSIRWPLMLSLIEQFWQFMCMRRCLFSHNEFKHLFCVSNSQYSKKKTVLITRI